MQNSNIAIVILSCDKFKVTWKPCIEHFFNAWPDCPHPVYLLNNFISCDDRRVKNLLIGEDFNWSDTLIKGLGILYPFFINLEPFPAIGINKQPLFFLLEFFLDLLNLSKIDLYQLNSSKSDGVPHCIK